MSRKYFLGVLIVVAFLVVPLLNPGRAAAQWAPWGRVEGPKEPTKVPDSAPLEPEWRFEPVKEEKPQTADDIVQELVDDFNSRYGYNIQPPKIEFINGDQGEYHGGTIYIPQVSDYAIAHETCHYFQDKVRKFESYGESFCEIYARADRKEYECEEKKWPYYYCTPFRLENVDRQEFIDCVFGDLTSDTATKDELMGCYEKANS